jgi:hypothetical protein
MPQGLKLTAPGLQQTLLGLRGLATGTSLLLAYANNIKRKNGVIKSFLYSGWIKTGNGNKYQVRFSHGAALNSP